MSHAKERKEKNCLNCNAVVTGRFCSVCGQENIETHQTFGHLAGHFVSDIFHFDGKFFSTANYLLFKPGFLTYEYMRGRRASYLEPIKMYFFVSAVFFLFSIGIFKEEAPLKVEPLPQATAAEVVAKLKADTANIHLVLRKNEGTSFVNNSLREKLAAEEMALAEMKRDTLQKTEIFNRLIGPSFFGVNQYTSVEEYDSLQTSLPEGKRDGRFLQMMTRHNIEIGKKFRDNKAQTENELKESIFHHVPQTLFVSLPLFALLLQLLFARHKTLFYANHAIYTLHLYCALFVFMFVSLVLGELSPLPYLHWLNWVDDVVIFYAVFYTFRALQVYYGQSFGKMLVKWLLLNVLAFLIMVILVVAMVAFSIYTI